MSGNKTPVSTLKLTDEELSLVVEAQRRALIGMTDKQRRKLLADGLLIPTELSWRAASRAVKRGWATLYPFHRRWLGKLTITPAGRAALAEPDRR